jgi:hypothetical protein
VENKEESPVLWDEKKPPTVVVMFEKLELGYYVMNCL